jgi:hypothetical protein
LQRPQPRQCYVGRNDKQEVTAMRRLLIAAVVAGGLATLPSGDGSASAGIPLKGV